MFQNLLDKVDMVSDDHQRWKTTEHDVPTRLGKIEGLEKFDAGFFGMHPRQATTTDCLGRILLEKTTEAVYDAGMNLEELRGSKTGVYVALNFTESERVWLYQKLESGNFSATGFVSIFEEVGFSFDYLIFRCFRSVFSNRISYWLEVNGPCCCLDTGCNSSIVALESAYRAIRKGECDSAIVGTGNVCLTSNVAAHFKRCFN